MHPSAFSPLLYAQIVLLQAPLWVRVICAKTETHLYCLFCIAFCWERSLAEVIESLCAVYGKDYVEKSRWKLIYKALTGSLDRNRALRRVLLFGSIEDRCMRNDSPQTTVDRLKKINRNRNDNEVYTNMGMSSRHILVENKQERCVMAI